MCASCCNLQPSCSDLLHLTGLSGSHLFDCNVMQHAKALLMGTTHEEQALAKKTPTAQVRDPENPSVSVAAAEQFLYDWS